MKFNQFNFFLLLLTIFAVVAFAYPDHHPTRTSLLKRASRNPNCDFSCCKPGDAKCDKECGFPTCTCNPKASCCRPGDDTCLDVCKLRKCEPRESPIIHNWPAFVVYGWGII